MPYLTQRSHGRLSSQRLQAAAQFVQAILTCLRFGLMSAGGTELVGGAKGVPWCVEYA